MGILIHRYLERLFSDLFFLCKNDVFSEKRAHFTFNFERGFDDFYFLEENVRIDRIKLQQEEVQAVKWASREEILAMIEAGTFIPYYPSLVDLIFESRHQRGCHTREKRKEEQ